MGYRKRRMRCCFVEVRTGLQCAKQVKKAGSRFCSLSHAARNRVQTTKAVVEPGARATYRAARAKDEDRLLAQLRMLVDDHGRVSLLAVLPVAMHVADARYARGYAAGRAKRRFDVRKLRLTESKAALETFMGSRFGKAFIGGDLSPDDLAKFTFGFKR